MGLAFSLIHGFQGRSGLRKTLLKHFGLPAAEITTSGRQFPITTPVDIQFAIQQLLQDRTGTKLLGIVGANPHEPPQLAQMLSGGHFPVEAGPLQHDEIGVGEPVPVRCLRCGLWLWKDDRLPVAVLMAPGGRFGLCSGVQVEIAA